MFRADILAQNIKKCRVKMGYTQSELAEKLYISGQAISKWEAGQSVPDIDNLCTLANIFSTSVDKLIGNTADSVDGKIFIGVDGGATKTEFVLFSEKGKIIHHICSDGCNPNVCGIEKSQIILKQGIDSMLSMRGDVAGVFVGMAGFTSGNNATLLEEYFKKSYPLLKITLGTDICNVIASATELEKCVAVICGTGFSIFANEDGKLTRVGGWGYLLDNIGGGYGIGREAIRAALAQRDGFGEKTLLTEMVEEKMGGKTWECLDKIYKGGDSFIASFAPLVFEAYTLGDKVSINILENYTDHMAKLLEYTLKSYDCGKNIIIAGGLLSDNNVIVELLCKKLGEGINYIKPELPQIYGACYKCCKTYGVPEGDFFNNFNRNYKLLKLRKEEERA